MTGLSLLNHGLLWITFTMVLRTSENLPTSILLQSLFATKKGSPGFDGLAEISKSTYGWFFGFKLHLVINEIGEIQT
ncbi:IS982 family transposase [Wolbachia endosymbiont of Cylisticus convexus]|nr:IS982 family transposase [Wolbachia endosymbiont of Cylisticus convexus]